MKKVLIVDDQAEVRELVRVTLEVTDYMILTAENGWQALEVALRERPDLVLLDVMMSEGPDGLEVCQQLKSGGSQSPIVVMLTARGQELDKEAGYAAGADDYFVKPFSPLEVIRKVDELLA